MAGKRPLISHVGAALMFAAPNIEGKQYRPGRQPNAPGESQMDGQQFPYFRNIPWPRPVASLNALASSPGLPRARALQISNNAEAPLPANNLFLAGFAGKSQG